MQKGPSTCALGPWIPGGERGIRTPDRLLTYTRFPGVRLKPLIHLSEARDYSTLRGLAKFPSQTKGPVSRQGLLHPTADSTYPVGIPSRNSMQRGLCLIHHQRLRNLIANRLRFQPVSYTHLTLPTTPYV